MVNTRAILILFVSCSLCMGARAQTDHHSMEKIAQLIKDAAPGDTILVPPGIYEGNLRITKPIVLDGQDGATFDGLGKGSVVELTVANITLRNLTIRGSGSTVDHEPSGIRVLDGPVLIENNHLEDIYFGIDLRQSPDSIIRNNTIVGKELELGRRGDGIRLWWSHGCIVEDNQVRELRDMVFWYSENLKINRNRVSESRYGLHFMYSHETVLNENELTNNSVGIYLMYSNTITLLRNRIVNNRGTSGYGVGLKDCDDIKIENNVMLANRVGVYVDNSPSSIDSVGLIARNNFSFNEIGVLATPITHGNVIVENVFIENEEQVAVHGGGQLKLNTFSDAGVGNFWSDYAGFDLKGDGIGDSPYAPQNLFRTLLARQPNLRIFVHSPAQQAIEFASRAFPDLSPEPMFEDPTPLSRPPKLDILEIPLKTSRVPMILLSMGLIVFGTLSAWFIARQAPLPLAELDRSIQS